MSSAELVAWNLGCELARHWMDEPGSESGPYVWTDRELSLEELGAKVRLGADGFERWVIRGATDTALAQR